MSGEENTGEASLLESVVEDVSSPVLGSGRLGER
jgi:hypothetical protein